MRCRSSSPAGLLFALALLALACQGEDITNEFATGQLTVVTTTAGDDPDPDGYTIELEHGQEGSVPIGANGQVQLKGLASGDYGVTLSGVAAHCSVAEGLTQTVAVSEQSVATVTYTVTCSAVTPPAAQWTRIPLPPSFQANGGLWGTSPSDLFVTGYAENPSPRYGIWHYDGSGWTEQVSRADTSIKALWGFSGTDVYAVGNRAAAEMLRPGAILHYDGSRWSDVSGPVPDDPRAQFSGVWGTSPEDVFLAGWGSRSETGAALVGHFDGQAWSRMSIPGLDPDAQFLDLSGTSRNDVWAVGWQRLRGCETCWDAIATIAHFDGSGWTKTFQTSFMSFIAIWAVSPNDAWVVGLDDGGQALLFHYNGAGWSEDEAVTYNQPALRDVWASSSSDVFAVGSDVLLHFDGTSWNTIPDVGGDRVWGPSRNDVFVLRANEILHLKR